MKVNIHGKNKFVVKPALREYIEKQVASKFPKTEIELYQEQQEQIANKMNQEYYDRVEKAKADIIASIAKEYEIHEGDIAIRNNYGNVFSTFNTPTAMLANTAKSLGGMMQEAKSYGEIPQLFALVGLSFLVGLILETAVMLLANWVERKVG
jgi:ribosome-associated translation inhibitor RaiA